MHITIEKPSTVVFLSEPLTEVTFFDRDGKIYYERRFARPVEEFIVNFPDTGNYQYNAPLLSYKRLPLQQFKKITKLPKRERAYNPDKTTIIVDDRMVAGGTPAKIYPARGVIHVSPEFLKLPKYQQEFILEHERGHMWYQTEEYCDIFAAKRMLDRGYNESSCVYALTRVLKRSPDNVKRIGFTFSNMAT